MEKSTIAFYIPSNTQYPDWLTPRTGGEKLGQFPANGPDNLKGGRLQSVKGSGSCYPVNEYTWKKTQGIHIGFHSSFNPNQFLNHTAIAAALPKYTVNADQYSFAIPVALLEAPNFNIPMSENLDDSGAVVKEIPAQYQDICEYARMIWEAIDEKTSSVEWEESEYREIAVKAVQFYYTLSKQELFALGIMNDKLYVNIFKILIDDEGMAQIYTPETKKKMLDELEKYDTNSG